MKYKVGDRVKVREDLKVDKEYGEFFFTENMKKFVGKTLMIVEVYRDSYAVEGHNYSWTDEMFDGLAESRKPQPFKVTNELFFRNILEPMGYKIGDKFKIEDYPFNPYYINNDYRWVDKGGNTSDIIIFPGENIIPYEEPKTKEEILKDLKEIRGDWKPDWEDEKGDKWTAHYLHTENEWVSVSWCTSQGLGAIHFPKVKKEEVLTYLNNLSKEETYVLLGE